jgi:hypothetical protein
MRRALAQTQQHEHERAVADYTAALLQTPEHLTPVEQPAWVPLCRVRRALALESLNRMDSLETAVSDLEIARGCVLPTDLLRLATDGIQRISRNLELDSVLRKQHPADEGLVRSDQLLRLYFSSVLPTGIRLNEPLALSVHVANELGCWRRDDFAQLFSNPTTQEGAASAETSGSGSGSAPRRMPLAVTVRAWPPTESSGSDSAGIRLELLGAGTNLAEAEADAALAAAAGADAGSATAVDDCTRTDGCGGGGAGSVISPRVAHLTEAGRVTMIVRIITDGCIGAAPGAVQLQVESSVTVQLQRAVVGVLSLPMALEQEPSPALARVATRASAVYAEACRELVVSHNTDAAEPGAVDSSTRGHNHEWRLMAAESGGYLGIGARPSFLFSVPLFALHSIQCLELLALQAASSGTRLGTWRHSLWTTTVHAMMVLQATASRSAKGGLLRGGACWSSAPGRACLGRCAHSSVQQA